MFVAISYRQGVDFCSEYDKCDGDYFANFICREFPKMFRRSAKSHSKLQYLYKIIAQYRTVLKRKGVWLV